MKYEILKLLKEKRDYISGEEMAKHFGVSRTAVWKNITKLKNEGYNIKSVSNRGYFLEETNDILNISEIDYNNAFFLETVDSTNEECKRQAVKGKNDGLLVVCDYQSAGKGRLGRTWVAESHDNLCMSFLLYPDISPMKAPQLTLLTGMAVCEAIKEVTGLNPGIKWPNDILVNGKKVVGILTELSAEIDCIKYVVVGIGINVNNSSFSEELKNKATSMYIETGKKFYRKDFIKPIADRLMEYYKQFCAEGFAPFTEKYNSLCLNIGQEVKTIGREEIEGTALGINSEGCLMIKDSTGKIHDVFTGEVSLRKKDNSYI